MDKRNNLLHLNQKSRMVLKIESSSLSDLYARISSAGDKGLQLPSFSQILNSDQLALISGELEVNCEVRDLQRRLSALRRRDREWEEEQGTNVLYVVFGLLEWSDPTSAGVAPLVLLPADLIQRSPRHPYFLAREPDEPTVNTTLIHFLSRKGILIPEFKPDEDLEGYLDRCDERLGGNDFCIRREAILTCLAYSKMGMWQDIETIRTFGTRHPLLNAMIDGSETPSISAPLLKSIGRSSIDDLLCGGFLDDVLSEREKHLVLPADYSQCLAIHYAQSGEHLIIHGPPGTGKSQTIANLISTLLADGKTVLFVSEKTAALDVVKRRLDSAGLGRFCLDLHSDRGKPTEVYRQIAETLLEKETPNPSVFPSNRYKALQSRLNKYAQALHQRRTALNLSVFEVLGRLAGLDDADNVDLKISSEEYSADHLTQEKFDSLLSLCRRIAHHRKEFKEHIDGYWQHTLKENLAELALGDKIRKRVNTLRASLREYQMAGIRLAETYRFPQPSTTSTVESYFKLVDAIGVSKWRDNYPKHWLSNPNVAELSKLLKYQAELETRRAELSRVLGNERRKSLHNANFLDQPSLPFPASVNSVLNSQIGKCWPYKVSTVGHAHLNSVIRFKEALNNAHQLISSLSRLLLELVNSDSTTGTKSGAFDPSRACSSDSLSAIASIENWLNETLTILTSEGTYLDGRTPSAIRVVRTCSKSIAQLRTTLSEFQHELATARALSGLSFETWGLDAPMYEWMSNTLRQISSHAMALTRSQTVDRLLPIIREIASVKRDLEIAERELISLDRSSIMSHLCEEELKNIQKICQSKWKRLNPQYRRVSRLLCYGHESRHRTSATVERVIAQAFKVREYKERLQCLQAEFDIDPRSNDLRETESDLRWLKTLFETKGIDSVYLLRAIEDCKIRSALIANQSRLIRLEILAERQLSNILSILGAATTERLFEDLITNLATFERSLDSVIQPICAMTHVLHLASDIGHAASLATIYQELKAVEDELRSNLRQLQIDSNLNIDWLEASACIQWIDQANKTLRSQTPEINPIDALTTTVNLLNHMKDYHASRASLLTDLDRLRHLVRLPWQASSSEPTFADIHCWLDELDSQSTSAADWVHYQYLSQLLRHRLGTDSLVQMRGQTNDSRQVPRILEKYLLLCWLEKAFQDTPALRDFKADEHERAIAAFEELDRVKSVTTAREEVTRKLLRRYPSEYALNSKVGEVATVIGEIRKQRGRLPIRKLLEKAPTVLRLLKPCIMMSPLAVSQILPSPHQIENDFLFDTLIFDEASQIFPEDAIPAISRCEQIIVVGDEQQLPPSNFFNRTTETDENEEDESVEHSVSGSESILGGIRKLTHLGIRECHLNMHYRSRDERLIAFSNEHFYGNHLLTFPSPYRDSTTTGIFDYFVDNAYYDSGKTRRNEGEARLVVDLVIEHFLLHGSERSLGVAALSRAQADFIHELLQERRKANPDLEQYFSEEVSEPVFVKNLENVQGDERDHIILCIGYGRSQETGKVPNRFGPINLPGGERRLNVAVSRARQNLSLVRSIRPADITSDKIGPRLLKEFIQFCEHSAGKRSHKFVIEPSTSSILVQRVQQHLESAGYEVYNCSSNKSPIDLAILSADKNRLELGIQFDGKSFYSAPTARDREWLRKSVLEEMGWNICRTWSLNWIKNPKESLAQIERDLEVIRNSSPLNLIETKTRRSAISTRVSEPTGSSFPDARPKRLFHQYQYASLNNCARTSNYTDIERLIMRLAESEGPIHFEEALDRLREHLNVQRVSKQLRDHVAMIMGDLRRESKLLVSFDKQKKPVFFSLYNRLVIPRSPADKRPVRKIERVSPSELDCGAVFVIQNLFSVSLDDCIKEVANQFGYNRVGPDILEAIQASLKRLHNNGTIENRNSLLTVSEERAAAFARKHGI